jgi:hypothetical protein
MAVNKTLSKKLEDLATKIAEQALKDDTNFQDKLEAFKQLTNFHVNTSKLKPKEKDSEEGGFNAYRERVKQTETD